MVVIIGFYDDDQCVCAGGVITPRSFKVDIRSCVSLVEGGDFNKPMSCYMMSI